MIRATSAALLLFLLALIGMTLWIGMAVHGLIMHLDGAVTRAEAIETKANATLVNLDKGTAVWAASAKDQAGAVQELAKDAHGTLSQANTALQGVSGVAQHVQGTADAATGLLASTRTTTDQLPKTLTALNGAIGNIGDLAGTGNDSLNQFNSLMSRKSLTDAIDHINGMTASGDAILGDARKVSDKATGDYLSTKPWYRKVGRYASDAFDYGALFARHTP